MFIHFIYVFDYAVRRGIQKENFSRMIFGNGVVDNEPAEGEIGVCGELSTCFDSGINRKPSRGLRVFPGRKVYHKEE
jgi:hypothetical protein